MKRTQAADTRQLPYSADEVFRILANLAEYPRWMPPQLGARLVRQTPEVIGSQVELGPRGGRFRCEIVGLEPGRSLEIHYNHGAHRGTGQWRLQPVEGGTRLTYAVDLEPRGWLLRALSHLIDFGRLHSRMMQPLLAALEQRLRAAAPPPR